jgi:carboxymethylenebutenolidase
MLLAAASSLMGGRAGAAPQDATMTQAAIVVGGRPVPVTKYLAPGTSRRPAVLLLHGSRGFEARIAAYDRYARDLAAAGIDARLVSYYQPGERAAIRAAGSPSRREIRYAQFVDGWVSLIRATAEDARKQDLSSGKVGLLGFSLGGLIAVAAASQPLFSALVVCYGGLPGFYHHSLSSLPPLLAIHGDADRAVPLASGTALVAKAKSLGGPAELALFPNQGHGFDLDLGNRDSDAARGRAVGFLKQWLAPSG